MVQSEGLDAVYIPQLAHLVKLVVNVQLHRAHPCALPAFEASIRINQCDEGLTLVRALAEDLVMDPVHRDLPGSHWAHIAEGARAEKNSHGDDHRNRN